MNAHRLVTVSKGDKKWTSHLKWGAVVSFVVAMLVLIGGGYVIKDELPPYPEKVVSEDGNLIFNKDAIIRMGEGRNTNSRRLKQMRTDVYSYKARRGVGSE